MAKDDKKTEITVVAKQESRYRAGLGFTKEPRTVSVTEEQKALIAGDPELAIVANPQPAKS